MPNYEVQHTYVRTDVYIVEAETPQEALELVRAGEIEVDTKLDDLPESIKVWAVDEDRNPTELLLTQEKTEA